MTSVELGLYSATQ